MKQRITDILDYLPEDMALSVMDESAEKSQVYSKRPAFKIPRLAAAIVVLVCGALLGIVTMIAQNNTKSQPNYIERDHAEMFFMEEKVSVENKDYRLTVEEVVLKNDEKTVLVSLEALNEKSWENMETQGFSPCLMTWWDKQWDKQLVDGIGESSWKKYYLMDFSCAGQYACTVCFAPTSNIGEFYWIGKASQNSDSVGDFLSIKINVEEPIAYSAR